MQTTFITLYIDLLEQMQDPATWQHAAAKIPAHVRWPSHLPRGSVEIQIQNCIPEAFHGFLVAKKNGACAYCAMDAAGRMMSQDMLTDAQAAIFLARDHE